MTHIWAVTGGSATEILTNDGAPLALTVSPGGDLWATLYDSVNGNVVTRLIAQSLGGVTSL